MKHTWAVAVAVATLLGGCAQVRVAPELTDDERCGGPKYQPKEHRLQVIRTSVGKPAGVGKESIFCDCDAAALLVCTGDTVRWKHTGQFSIVFDAASGSPTEGDQVEFPGRGFVTIAIKGDGSVNKVYKYTVKNDAGALDPMIVVER
jgi:hypothetical protein